MLRQQRTRICIVNPFEHGGGAEYQIGLLIDALADSGDWDIHYVTHFVDERRLERRYQLACVGAGGSIPRFGYLMEAKSLYRQLDRLLPDIIYQRVACAYTGICAYFSARRGVPMLWHVAHDTEVTPQHLDDGRNKVRLHAEKWAVEYGARRASHVVVQTQQQADLLLRHYARRADAVIPNFHPLPLEKIDKSGVPTVVWIANLKPWKQPEIFVRLAQAMRNHPAVRFIMLGAPAPESGNTHWQQALKREIGSTSNLEYRGNVTQGDVNQLLARAHVFVNTSVHEGFPNTFIQAWQRDVAVVSLQVDPDQVLSRLGAGILARSETGLIDAVRNLVDDPAVRAQFIERGRGYANANHSLRNLQDLTSLLTGYTRQSISPHSSRSVG